MRITPHLYNHEVDVARLLEVLVAALRKAQGLQSQAFKPRTDASRAELNASSNPLSP